MFPNMEAQQPFSDQDWQATPEPVRQYIMELEQTIAMLINKVKQLEKRTEKLENKTNQNSQNSSKPPSSDSPFKKPKKKRKESKRNIGSQKGHKGHKQQLLKPTQQQEILPEKCDCVRSDDELKDIPFIMVTAEAQKDNIVEAVKAGVSNYIVKPFTAETISEKLNKIFGR